MASENQRFKDNEWTVAKTYDGAQLAVLMDIRDELKRLNTLLHCSNFVSIPAKLKQISRNTAKPRKRKRG